MTRAKLLVPVYIRHTIYIFNFDCVRKIHVSCEYLAFSVINMIKWQTMDVILLYGSTAHDYVAFNVDGVILLRDIVRHWSM